MIIEKPSLRGMTQEQAIATIDTWISRTADTLNYLLENLDNSNMVEDYVTKEEIKDLLKGE